MSGAFHPPASRPLRRWLHADERGSVVAESDAAGQAVATYAYGPWGELDTTAGGRFRYTGQALIPELGLYYYKARMYSAYLGRFLQTDPAGYADGLNLYAYAGGDPINATDPSGLEDEYFLETIFVLGNKQKQEPLFVGLTITGGSLFNFGGSGGDAGGSSPQMQQIAARPNLCDRREWHNLRAAEKVAALRAAGFQVASEVRIRLLGPNKEGFAIADYIATVPGSNVFRIGEVKTGGATLTKRQMEHYGIGIAQVLGGDATPVGLQPGEFIPVVWTGEDRFPGCPAKG